MLPITRTATLVLAISPLIANCSLGVEGSEKPANQISGSLTFNDETIDIGYAEYSPWLEPTMMLLMVPTEADVDSAYSIGGNSIALVLDLETGRLSTSFPSRIQYEGFHYSPGETLEPEQVAVELEILDGSHAKGRISMAPTEVGYDYENSEPNLASFELTVDVHHVELDPCTDLDELTLTGVKGKPAEAVERFFASMASCQWDDLEEGLTGQALAEWQKLAADEEMLELFVDFAVAEMPREGEILEVVMDGKDRAKVTVQFGSTDPADVLLERDGRRWKVVESAVIELSP